MNETNAHLRRTGRCAAVSGNAGSGWRGVGADGARIAGGPGSANRPGDANGRAGGRPGIAAYVPMDGFMRHAKLVELGPTVTGHAPHAEGSVCGFCRAAEGGDGAGAGTGIRGRSRMWWTTRSPWAGEAAERRAITCCSPIRRGGGCGHARFAVFIDVPRETVRARLMKRHAKRAVHRGTQPRAY